MGRRVIGASVAILLGASVASAFAMQPRRPIPDTAAAAPNEADTAVEQAPGRQLKGIKLK